MKNLEKLEQQEARVFARPRASLRDYWRMVRNLPHLVKDIVRTLGRLDGRLTRIENASQAPHTKGGRPERALPLSAIAWK